MTVQRARSHHATSQNPQDSKIYLPGFHRFKFEFHSFFAETFSTVSTHKRQRRGNFAVTHNAALW